jgi:prevent-host-death family protein
LYNRKSGGGFMESIGVSKLRENMVLFLNKVQQGESITITSRGTEIAMLIPIKKKKEVSINALKQLRKTAFVGDVVSPIEEVWKAMK